MLLTRARSTCLLASSLWLRRKRVQLIDWMLVRRLIDLYLMTYWLVSNALTVACLWERVYLDRLAEFGLCMFQTESQCAFAEIAVPDPNRIVDGRNKDLSIADLARFRRIGNRVHYSLQLSIGDNQFQFDLGPHVDFVFGATVGLRVALLTPMAMHFGNRDAVYTGVDQRFLYLFKFVRLNDRLNLFHIAPLCRRSKTMPRSTTAGSRSYQLHVRERRLSGPLRPV